MSNAERELVAVGLVKPLFPTSHVPELRAHEEKTNAARCAFGVDGGDDRELVEG